MSKKHEEHENHERWLVSYADFITLLFAFFVVMYASSSRDQNKLEQVEDSLTKSFGKHSKGMSDSGDGQPYAKLRAQRFTPIMNQLTPPPEQKKPDEYLDPNDPLKKLQDDLQAILKSRGQSRFLSSFLDETSLRITLDDSRNWQGDSALVHPEARGLLRDVLHRITEIDRHIKIEGIAVPSSKKNIDDAQQLLAKRAPVIKNMLVEAGFDENEIEVLVRAVGNVPGHRQSEFDDGMLLEIIVVR